MIACITGTGNDTPAMGQVHAASAVQQRALPASATCWAECILMIPATLLPPCCHPATRPLQPTHQFAVVAHIALRTNGAGAAGRAELIAKRVVAGLAGIRRFIPKVPSIAYITAVASVVEREVAVVRLTLQRAKDECSGELESASWKCDASRRFCSAAAHARCY